MNLRKLRTVVAAVVLVAVTLLFLDFTGTAHLVLGWLAKIQFLPAVLALNVGVVVALVVLTLLFGRLYCSVICPLGILQDLFGRLGRKAKKNRYGYSKPRNVLRYGFLVLFVALMVAGVGQVAALIAPYSAFGRIASTLLTPVWQLANNGLAWVAERAGSYAFYSV
ncbi:MAG: 4Fe-4S binding protein, partial [Alistipes sp.]|nr:4Fe-4S binding protein [Alistipes sp.]